MIWLLHTLKPLSGFMETVLPFWLMLLLFVNLWFILINWTFWNFYWIDKSAINHELKGERASKEAFLNLKLHQVFGCCFCMRLYCLLLLWSCVVLLNRRACLRFLLFRLVPMLNPYPIPRTSQTRNQSNTNSPSFTLNGIS